MVLLPVIILLVTTYPIDFKRLLFFLSCFAICGGSWVVEQFVRGLGQQTQEVLRFRWGGRPATLFMRHQDPSVVDSIKRVWHEKYAVHLSVPFPTAAEERRQPAHADAIYTQAASWSERHTEDRTKFRTLWQCRAQYEFMLNGFALRGIGLTTSIFCSVWACLRSGAVAFGSHPGWELSASMSLRPGSALVVLLSLTMASVWLFWFTENRVRGAARLYDMQLLEVGGQSSVSSAPSDLPIQAEECDAREA
jgi:hypothetical protein